MKNRLQIKDLHVETTEGKKILNGISLTVTEGEIHAIMGPNGGGKSTFAQVLMGHPGYVITEGTIVLNGKDLTNRPPDERAQAGLFLGFQYPVEVAGVNFGNFLRMAINTNNESRITNHELLLSSRAKSRDLTQQSSTVAKDSLQEDYPLRGGASTSLRSAQNDKIHKKKLSPIAFRNAVEPIAKELGFTKEIVKRSLNEGFSGGEKKKAEILQLALLKPAFAILDEPDSGLDVDALRYIGNAINALDYPLGLVLITHYQRILQYIKPQFVHIVINGKIALSGDHLLAKEIEEKGYEQYLKNYE